ncbi:MAG: hypothetical protein IT460_17470 [Planctomycetes bacterium]|nr:hypothetical protein [Planctomycetota bacterium]
MPPLRLRTPAVLLALGAAAAAVAPVARLVRGDGPTAPPGPTRAAQARWLDEDGTAILSFGLLRVAPATPGARGTVTVRYEERPTDYARFVAVQLLVLPGDAFGSDGRAFADRTRAWAKSPAGSYEARVAFDVTEPALVVVGFGPFSGPDTSRPLGTRRAYTLDVTDDGRVTRAWVDADAGELTVKAWTARPEIVRGGPVRDPVDGVDRWFEVRPELVFDGTRLRAPSDPEAPQTAVVRREAQTLEDRARALRDAGKADAAADLEREAADLRATLGATDDRLPVPEALAARLRRIPFQWR